MSYPSKTVIPAKAGIQVLVGSLLRSDGNLCLLFPPPPSPLRREGGGGIL
jgi:hypothetical protein